MFLDLPLILLGDRYDIVHTFLTSRKILSVSLFNPDSFSLMNFSKMPLCFCHRFDSFMTKRTIMSNFKPQVFNFEMVNHFRQLFEFLKAFWAFCFFFFLDTLFDFIFNCLFLIFCSYNIHTSSNVWYQPIASVNTIHLLHLLFLVYHKLTLLLWI